MWLDEKPLKSTPVVWEAWTRPMCSVMAHKTKWDHLLRVCHSEPHCMSSTVVSATPPNIPTLSKIVPGCKLHSPQKKRSQNYPNIVIVHGCKLHPLQNYPNIVIESSHPGLSPRSHETHWPLQPCSTPKPHPGKPTETMSKAVHLKELTSSMLVGLRCGWSRYRYEHLMGFSWVSI